MSAPRRDSPRRAVGVDLKNDGRRHAQTVQQLAGCARLAEECGFESVWLNEDVGHDSMLVLSAIAHETSSLRLGTAIVNVYSRSAMQMAMSIGTLDEISGGRATLGLSVGHHPWNDLYHGMPIEAPLARVREYVAFIRRALSGEAFQHEGRVFKGVNGRLAFRPPQQRLPIFVGGERAGIIKVAGEVADGLIINVVPPGYVGNFAARHYFDSAAAAGRDPARLELTAIVTCCLGTDLSSAREKFVSRVAGNPERMRQVMPEFAGELDYISGLIDAGQHERAEREVSAELVTALIATGGAADLWRRVEDYFAAGATRVAVAPYPRDEEHAKLLLEALAPYVQPEGAKEKHYATV